jgi:AraC-like DNA-binding protein
MADVKWTFFADTAAAERAIQRLEQQNAKLENSLAQVSRKSKDSSGAFVSGMKQQLMSVVQLGAGLLSVQNLLATAHNEAQKLFRVTDAVANRTDVSMRKIRILGNLDAVQGDAAKDRIHTIAQQMGYSNTEGEDAARELTSAGFDIKEATGESLKALFKSLAANQEFGENINTGDLARASASYLQSQGQELTGENLERIGIFVKKLADVSTVGIADLGEIAKHGATFSGKLTQEEQFAGVTALRKEGRPGSEAANALEKVTLSLTGKGDKKKTQEALKELGLDSTDVDMIGESFLESLKKLDEGLKKVAPERQDTILTKLFGVEHISAAKSLITKNDYVAQLTAGQNDREGFDRAVSIGTGGRAASERRAKAFEEDALESTADRFSEEAVKSVRRAEERKAGFSGLRTSLNDMQYSLLRSFGANQETAVRSVTGSGERGSVGGSVSGDKVIQILEQTLQSSKEQTAAIKANAPPKPTLKRNAHGEGAP